MRVVYNSFEGRFSDSPRVLHGALAAARPDSSHLWLADARQAGSFPPGVATVPYGSAEAVAALEAADLVVANTHTDVEWCKRDGALYLQTWHGTPLKRLHWDVMWAPAGRLERLSRDVERWDVLLSPNRPTTPRLRHAFRYDGEILETGYPRNDVLSAPDRDDIRARLRRDLGIDEGTTVVLYTPTWRDDAVFAEGGKHVELALDLEAFDAALGDDHVLLLRLHYMVAGRLSAAGRASVRDVSTHPDVSALYLAADVLVTDYSSTVFDFAVTGKPIIFFAYDAEDYGSRLRGFYFDLVPDAPGPIVRTTPEVISALRDLAAVTERHAERYARFRATFCHLEDGHATERVVARVLDAVAA